MAPHDHQFLIDPHGQTQATTHSRDQPTSADSHTEHYLIFVTLQTGESAARALGRTHRRPYRPLHDLGEATRPQDPQWRPNSGKRPLPGCGSRRWWTYRAGPSGHFRLVRTPGTSGSYASTGKAHHTHAADQRGSPTRPRFATGPGKCPILPERRGGTGGNPPIQDHQIGGRPTQGHSTGRGYPLPHIRSNTRAAKRLDGTAMEIRLRAGADRCYRRRTALPGIRAAKD